MNSKEKEVALNMVNSILALEHECVKYSVEECSTNNCPFSEFCTELSSSNTNTQAFFNKARQLKI